MVCRRSLTRIFCPTMAALAIALWSGTAASAQTKSLYDRLGGAYAIAAVVDDFIDRLLKDPVVTANTRVVASLQKVTVPGLKFYLTEQLCAAAGGPQKYTGRPMREIHKDMGITDREWDASAADLKAALDKFKVPEREQREVFAIVVSTKRDVVVPLSR